jgi:hypothetical protein
MAREGLTLTSDENERSDRIVEQLKRALESVDDGTSQLVVMAAVAKFVTLTFLGIASSKGEAKEMLTDFAPCVDEMIDKAQRPH